MTYLYILAADVIEDNSKKCYAMIIEVYSCTKGHQKRYFRKYTIF